MTPNYLEDSEKKKKDFILLRLLLEEMKILVVEARKPAKQVTPTLPSRQYWDISAKNGWMLSQQW